jgi:steroid delta-isomerase-like uncharacterized protein
MNRLILSMFVLLVLAVPLAPALGADSTADLNKALVRQVYEEIFNTGNLEQLDKYFAADSVDHEVMPGRKEPQTCQDNIKEFLGVFRKAFPDLQIKVDDLIAEGDKVVARCTLTGTHKGEFMGMPPTGKTFSIQVIDIVRFTDGKCVEHWGISDDAELMQQLGDAGLPK